MIAADDTIGVPGLPGVRPRDALPAVGAVLSALLMTAPLFGPAPLVPHLPLLVVIVWSLYHPRLLPPLLALGVGIVTDLALAMPLGVNATTLPAAALLLPPIGRRLGSRPFRTDWLLAGPTIAIALLATWQLAAIAGVGRDPALMGPQWLITWALFPAAARVSAWAQRLVAR